jgi:type I restriction enzyme S subunit
MSKIPAGWVVKQLGDILSGSYRNGIYKDSSFYGTGVSILRINDFDNHGQLTSKVLNKVNLNESEIASFKLEKSDIVINRVNSITHLGKSILWKSDEKNVVYESNMMCVKSNRKLIDPEFLIQLLQSNPTREFFQKAAKRAVAQASISQRDVKSLFVLQPPLPEQTKIAQILSTWDKAITTTEQLIGNSQQQKIALMQSLLTGKKRLPGFEGEWTRFTLDKVATIAMGSSPKSTAYNDLNIGLPLLQGNADINNRLSSPRIHTSQITRECYVGDILLSVRAPVGSVAKSLHHACIGRGIAAIKANLNAVQAFLYQWLLNYEPSWESLSQGSTFESVNSADIRNLEINLPSLPEQQKIAAVLTAADNEIELLKKKLAFLKQEKTALMQQLLTGKRRVKVEAA